MVTTIILALAVMTAAVVVGVFILALIELHAMDHIIDGTSSKQTKSL